ncbi:oxidoreductase [Rubrobacter aplysinae]|uniref:oxidoreductase n=1 Tax=Rubrobacter aplysinae TaxID=909625 RepID=UPI00064BBBF5|nr:NADH:flavin oxidoreductase [Rubrobacter aplysinae]
METRITSDSRLFSGVSIGEVELENRLAVAPMTRVSATHEGLATEDMVAYYESFARGGFGLIITEGIYPDEAHGQGYWNQPGLANDEQVESWRRVTEAVHEQGAKIFAQLMHAGALVQGNRFTEGTIGPSAVPPKGKKMEMYGGSGDFNLPEELGHEGISEVIRSFTAAALRAREAGFDGVEIHGANGYLLDQFLTDYTNRRTDEYGGPVENRVRLSAEVAEAVRQAVGRDFPVGMRVSQAKVNDPDHAWAGGESDAAVVFGRLSEAGLDYIHVTEPTITEPAFGDGPTLAALARRYGGGVSVIANGSLHDPRDAESTVREEADVAALGKSALANMDWPNRVRDEHPLEDFDPQVLESLRRL